MVDRENNASNSISGMVALLISSAYSITVTTHKIDYAICAMAGSMSFTAVYRTSSKLHR